MSYTYSQRKQAVPIGPKSEAASPQASPEALSNGAMQPTAEQLGRRVDLPDAMRSKMENAFGADLGAVKLYESRAVAETGAKAIARGADIAFAPGMLDFSSFGGQALLGHELSHVVSQARGEVTGSGFLSDAALEARADREGAMAAAGQAVAMPTASLSPVSAADAAGPMQAKDKPEKQEKFGFTSEPGEKSALPAGGIGFVLGMENADDPNHGAEFRQMMASLKANAVAKGNRRHLGGMAYDAMAGSGADQAITGMEAYRKKLKSERGNRAERKRQIAILDDMIARARSDKARTEARQTTELGGTEFTGTMLGGGINQVYQYARGGESAFFKPKKDESDAVEKSVMARTGIEPASPTHDPRLADREIAFSRLGALLGSSVTVDAKKATLGEDTPTGRKEGDRTFTPKAGEGGVLLGNAKGKSWYKYNWSYLGLGAGRDGAEPDPRRVLVDPAMTAGTNVGSRLDAAGGRMTRKTTLDPSYAGRYMLDDDAFSDAGGELDVTDSDYQRQMNELFLLDTLAGHTDRHAGNYHVSRDDKTGAIGVKAIDNDLTFGKGTPFGKRGASFNYGGLPAQMQVDARMAQRIGQIDRKTLDDTFSDVLEKEEIDALEARFGMMKDYIADLDPELLVDEWDWSTAQKEFRLAGGVNSFQHEDDPGGSGYSGNNYFQRQLLMLNAAQDIDDPWLLKGAIGHYVRF